MNESDTKENELVSFANFVMPDDDVAVITSTWREAELFAVDVITDSELIELHIIEEDL